MEPDVLSLAIRWLLERIESFPIPIEEALWVYTYASSDAVERGSRVEDTWEGPLRASNSR
jgi:hypothetical protein